jgi:two-component system response regulator AtoC
MLCALILEDDELSRAALVEIVEAEGFRVLPAGSLAEARAVAQHQTPDVALLDLMLPDGSGLEIMRQLQSCASTQIVLITGSASVDSAVEALRLGAADYLTKPIDADRLKTILLSVARASELKRELDAMRSALFELGSFGPLIGASKAMQEVYDLVGKVAPTDVSVLLTGESGTGKEEVATVVHSLSARRGRRFVAVNCGAVSPTLIESELFGHEKGSFTGATRQHKGLFEQASGGTLFLDEITEMPPESQVKLLRALETSTITRVGGEQAIKTDVRLVAATNENPESAVAAGKLRHDLLYRMSSFRITLPPLREREHDIDLLADYFVAQLQREYKTEKRLAKETREFLHAHPWKGNVRELKNAIQRAFIVAGDEIAPDCLPPEIHGRAAAQGGEGLYLKVGSSLAENERRLILATLEHVSGSKRKAAELLGISLKTLYTRLSSYQGENSGTAGKSTNSAGDPVRRTS